MHQLIAGIEQGKAAGAIGGLQHARLETGLPHGRRLLVARNTEDRQRRAEQSGLAKVCAAIENLGQQVGGDPKQLQNILVPPPLANVVEQRARGVGGVGHMAFAFGQTPDQEAVDRPEGQFSGLRTGAGAVDVVENPRQFRAAEVGVEQQARLVAHHVLVTRRFQLGADLGRAAVLPDNCIVDRRACLAVPDDNRFALVCDPDGRNGAALVERALAGLQHRLPDLLGIVFHPTRRRIMLCKFLLRARLRAQIPVEHDRTARGCALIDGKYLGHGYASLAVSM
mmetsp:Transcript_3019/g.5127  ORF Transcript_3019/g.5127 Transcript_3019/m.5127 type:complete len:282 (-) Transcript_3019:297-1142(-)